METYIHAMLGVLAVINPFVCGAMLLQIQKGSDKKTSIKATIKAMTTILLILIIAAVAGKSILGVFSISMDAFKIVGGIILSFMGFQMLLGPKDNSLNKKMNLSELVMFAASPGTIAMVISLAVVHDDEGIPVTAIVGVCSAVVITLIITILMLFLSKENNANSQNGFTKFMGLIIVAMGLQFMLTGIKDFFM
jgi:multiple antibiotic resistance protein